MNWLTFNGLLVDKSVNKFVNDSPSYEGPPPTMEIAPFGVTSISIGYNIGDPTPQVHNPNKYVATESAGSYYLVYLSETSGVKADCDASIAGNENKITVTGTYKN